MSPTLGLYTTPVRRWKSRDVLFMLEHRLQGEGEMQDQCGTFLYLREVVCDFRTQRSYDT